MKKFLLTSLFLFSLILNGVFVLHMLTAHKADAMTQDLHLSSRQKHLISKKTGRIQGENHKLELELKKCREDLYKLLSEEKPDRSKIESCINTISTIQKQLQKNTVEQLLVYKKHLSKEQCDCLMKNVGSGMGIAHKCKDKDCCAHHKY